MAALESGGLVSTLALHEGRVIGHHAVMPVPGDRSAETGAAVVHSAYRGLGVFGRMFEQTLHAASERGLASVFGDAVTIHPFSQRAERSQGYRETALQPAWSRRARRCAGSEARGRAGERPRSAPTDRSTARASGGASEPVRELLEACTPTSVSPSRLAASRLPSRARSSRPTSTSRARSDSAPKSWEGEARTALHQHRASSPVAACRRRLRGPRPGDGGRRRRGERRANELGFFAAGLVLHGADGHDHLRLQLLDSEEIELDEIVCDSPFAETLRRRVSEDRARVVG